MGEGSDEAILKEFLAEVSEVERDNEVARILSCFKLNPFEHLNLAFDSDIDEVKRQYRKLSLLVHPDKCKHPQAKEAFAGELLSRTACQHQSSTLWQNMEHTITRTLMSAFSSRVPMLNAAQ
eukprot:jgi/Mesen1/186/ME1136481C07560